MAFWYREAQWFTGAAGASHRLGGRWGLENASWNEDGMKDVLSTGKA